MVSPSAQHFDIRGDLVEDVVKAAETAGHPLSLDASEPRLESELTSGGAENVQAALLSHVPPSVRYGVP